MAYKGPFRDVYSGLQKFRDFLLGRWPHLKHGRFNPLLAPRTIPPPDIPRGPEDKYSGQYYCNRDPLNAVQPPLVISAVKPSDPEPGLREAITGFRKPIHVKFPKLPTPGLVYWWDGHCYYETVPDYIPPPPPPRAKIAPDVPSHLRRAKVEEDPCPLDPCDPCQPPNKSR